MKTITNYGNFNMNTINQSKKNEKHVLCSRNAIPEENRWKGGQESISFFAE